MTTAEPTQSETIRESSNGWRWARLGAVCRIVGGSTPRSDVRDYWGGDIVWVTPSDLGKLHAKVIANSERLITRAGFDSCGIEMVPAGSVVLSSRAPIGHLAIAGIPLCTNQGCKAFILGEEIDTSFLYLALKMLVPDLRAMGRGVTFAEVSKGQLERFGIPLPSLPEQRRIAAILTEQLAEVERARAAAEAQLTAAEALPAAYLRAVFESEEAREWPKKHLGGVCDITARQVDPRVPKYGVLLHINGENIESGTGILSGLRSASEDGMTSGKYLFDEGDVLYSKLRPYLRKVAVAPFHGVCSADMYPIKVDASVLVPEYLAWMLLSDSFTTYAEGESRRARMPKLNREQLFAWEAPIPPLAIQMRIAVLLDEKNVAAQRTRIALAAQLDAINLLPAALLRRAFSGELRQQTWPDSPV